MSAECELPLDILIGIFKKLPIESLIRFISVSKQLKSVIRSPQFISDYNSNHIQPNRLFVGYSYRNYLDIFNDDDVSFLQRLTVPTSAEHPDLEFNKLIGYSQGLFGFHLYNNKDSAVVIWNPSIRKSVFIPVPQHQQSFYRTHFVFIVVSNATDPMILKTSHNTGSGRQIYIYTLSTRVWRTLSNGAYPRESLEFALRKNIVIDRFIYWIVYDKTFETDLILSFDITCEKFKELSLPPSLAPNDDYKDSLHLSKLRGSLVVLKYDRNKEKIGVWMMMEPGVENSLRKLFTIKSPYRIDVLGFSKNGQPIMYSNFHSIKRVYLFYESDMERFIEIEVFGDGYPITAGSYMETLLLLDH